MTAERWQKIEQLYHAVLELQQGQRGAYLKQACAGDDALLQEVESLLAQQSSAEGFLETPAVAVAAKVIAERHHRSLVGQQLGSYKINSLLGAGGMGEVYRARDSKLGRDVAIKVLPAVFVDDAERLARFQREARMLAALNHPNIATIHGLEEAGGVHYLVMELVAGETLAERIGKGALELNEALKISGQIAEALEAAHERGVIHRDLKPANVKVTPEGRVKVLDFGLAKAFAGDEGQDLSNAPTLTVMGTEEGRILGTTAYMSPEQARGKAVDKRSDIWAFGCVLYELLVGKQAFAGETFSDTIAAILEKEPDWQALHAETPPEIRDVLRRCLQRSLRSRLHDIADARIEIEEALTGGAEGEPAAAEKGIRELGWRPLVLVAGAVLLGAVIAILVSWSLKPVPGSAPRPVTRTVINLPPGQQLAGLDRGPAVALSPDGTRLAYVARQGSTQQIYLRAMDSLDSRPLPGTEGAVNPFFSPDGQWLGFFADNKLKKISLSGGAALALADAGNTRGASWSSEGTIAFSPSATAPLVRTSDGGGDGQVLMPSEKGGNGEQWPEFLPGGKAILFVAGKTPVDTGVSTQAIGTSERRNLIPGGTQPRYAPSGHLVYAQGGSLMAVPFDSQRLTVRGATVPVVDGVLQSRFSGAAQYSISKTGSLVYVSGGVQSAQTKLVWVSRNGVDQPLAAPARAYLYPRLSPDGRRVAVGISGEVYQIWLYDISKERLTQFTIEGDFNNIPNWTPDGKRIAFMSNKDGPLNIFWQLADGGGGLERLTTSENRQIPQSWSPDGQELAFFQINPGASNEIFVLRVSDRKVQRFVGGGIFDPFGPWFSPDGHWLAYLSDESRPLQIYVQPYPGPGGKWQVSTDGGVEPVWNPNGKELFYRSGDKMMAVDITTQPGFSAGKPRVLFEGPYVRSPLVPPDYDVSPDGQRFLMLKSSEQEAAPTQINVVLNWFEELKQKVPTGKK